LAKSARVIGVLRQHGLVRSNRLRDTTLLTERHRLLEAGREFRSGQVRLSLNNQYAVRRL
jgi:hypothetical protein